ncbi:MAG: allantoate amidohydrolase [Terracidiphilus sp.]|jgi:allantoate deiminase
MRDRAARAIAECKLIAAMSEEPERITRRFLTPPTHDVHAHLRARMETLGMTVQVDAAGNLRGLWQPEGAPTKRLVLGSHIDTVPNGGAYDGVLGVVLALEWIALAQELALPLAIEAIAFSEEEGVRFGVPFLGSRAVAGSFDPALLALQDADGVTLEAAIRAFGIDPDRIQEAAVDARTLGFFEVHIEQGPELEAEGLSVAHVNGIVGQTRLSVKFSGQANHAGTTSMHLRRDALAAAAEWITQVEALALNTDGLVATVGKLTVEPNADNVVPGTARASLDVRHAHDDARASAVKALLAKAGTIAALRGLSIEWVRLLDQPAVPMDERLTAFLADAIEAAGLPVRPMQSGAGHDAMVMATRMPTAMLFLRSPGGISHHPAETVLEEDVQAALDVGRNFLARIAAKVG